MDNRLEEKIISLIFSLGRYVREHAGGEKSDVPSFIQLEMMQRIDEMNGLTMKEMAKFLYIKAPSVTYLIEDLVKNKYAKRAHEAKDRRVVKIVLTPRGKSTLSRLYPHRADSLRKALEHVSRKQKENFASTLEKINEIYKQKN